MTLTTNLTHPAAGPTRIEDLTRREFMFSALGAALLIACGDDDDDSAGAGATRDFTDSTGATIKVPVKPQRIVAVHDFNAGAQVLALGGPLIGMSTREGEFVADVSHFFDLTNVEPVGERSGINIEKIAELEPDLILDECYAGQLAQEPAVVERLRAIAPVVGIDTFRAVDDVMSQFSELLGEAATLEIDGLRREYESLLEEVRVLLGARWPDVTAGMVEFYPGNAAVAAWGPEAGAETLILNEMGVTWTPLNLEAGNDVNEGYLGEISMERLSEFNCDLLVHVDLAASGELKAQPLFQQLPVVEAGQVLELFGLPTGTHYQAYANIAQVMLTQLQALQPIRTDLV